MICKKYLFAGVIVSCAISTAVLAGGNGKGEGNGLAPLKPSEFSVAVISDEGGVGCNKISSNAFTREIRGRIPVRECFAEGEMVTAGFGEGYEDRIIYAYLKGDGETATVEYNCNTRELSFFDATVGIDAAIVGGPGRGGDKGDPDDLYVDGGEVGGSNVVTRFIYGSKRRTDSMIVRQNPLNGSELPSRRVSLCFGGPESTADQPLPECTENSAWLGAIDCSQVADGTVVTLWQPLAEGGQDEVDPQIDDRYFQCFCNAGGTSSSVACDPTGDGGDLPPCYTKDRGQTKATILVEFDVDPISCTTSGGTRKCKCVDNPFTSLNECATP